MRDMMISGAVACAVVLLAGCGSGSITVHGTPDNGSAYDPFGNHAPHSWVAVTGSTSPDGLSGKCLDDETIDVMATVGGRSVAVATGKTFFRGHWAGFSPTNGDCFTDFTIRNVPGGHDSYGIHVEGVPGTVNYTTAQLGKRISLSIGGGG